MSGESSRIFSTRIALGRGVLGFLILWMLAAGGPSYGQEARICVSSKAGEGQEFEINEATTHQKIGGFGASILEAGMVWINVLDPSGQESVLGALFDPKRGAGSSATKTTMGRKFSESGMTAFVLPARRGARR